MLSFLAVGFAVAGIAAAAGPVIIHLLNRRRHRTVNWAAMDFLREAMQRNRKTLQLRDVLLLLLRVSCVLLFGLALTTLVFSGMMVWTKRTAIETVKIVRERRQARLGLEAAE